ncbi:N-acetylneuraminate synthase [Christiangramia portivictoriae]|uniref:N-acetylneuraminate synthase n=1 Tax=Christiangramia portivictoriae TaxID=326069 RepID=UPI00041EFFB8|nr:N-acetylneuraminate synthase [Christiangramia portivictoriae]
MRNKVIIIAEAGVNHNGDISIAKKLIEAAAIAKADYVKFQTFIAEEVISKNAVKADYQIENTGNSGESQLEMVKKLQLSPEMHLELISHCNKHDIKFLSTAFDLKSIEHLEGYKLGLFKIPSGEITNLPYLEKIAAANYPHYVMSTGMANLSDIENALGILLNQGISRKNITILHCNTEYPTPMLDVNLKAMNTIASAFQTPVGYSDHTLGIEVPIAAVAMGASVIEKHFTLDKTMEGPDHKASLEPSELTAMVSAIRNIELALGDGIKAPSASEIKNIPIARKSLVAKKDISAGDIFTIDNLGVKRPGNGISPMQFHNYIGTVATKDYKEDSLI